MNRKRVVIIGGGPGGYVAAIRAAQLGAQVTLIEKDKIGGTCLNLDFSKAGVEVTLHGIQVNRRMETSAPHIYAVGDAAGGVLLAHVAMEEGMVTAENAMGFDREMDRHLIPLCIFTQPEVASIGLTEREAREKGEIKVGRFPFRSNPRAVISGETEGLIKVIANRETDEILGVHIIGLEACDLISIVSSLVGQGVKVKEFCRLIQAHPTVPEALREAFLDVDGTAIHLPRPLRGQKR
jgi:dihydrolipoamide dehydrogenase